MHASVATLVTVHEVKPLLYVSNRDRMAQGLFPTKDTCFKWQRYILSLRCESVLAPLSQYPSSTEFERHVITIRKWGAKEDNTS